KAGIAKPGVPLVIGRVPPEAEAVITAHAAEVGAPVVRAGPDGALEKSVNGLAFCRAGEVVQDGIALALEGAFQLWNAEVALLLLSRRGTPFAASAAGVHAGLAGVRWPGRLAVLRDDPLVVVDGAHNPAGVAALAAELPRLVGARRLVLVFAVMADKAWPAMLEHLLPSASEVIVTRVGRRGLDPGGLAAAMSGRVPAPAAVDP